MPNIPSAAASPIRVDDPVRGLARALPHRRGVRDSPCVAREGEAEKREKRRKPHRMGFRAGQHLTDRSPAVGVGSMTVLAAPSITS